MKVSKSVKEKKQALVREILTNDISTPVPQIQHELKMKFNHGITGSEIVAIRRTLSKNRSQGAASTAQALKATGVRTRIKPPEKAPTPVVSTTADVMMQRQVEDLANIIRKRIPGIRKFVLLIGDDGKPSVEYNVIASLEGKVHL